MLFGRKFNGLIGVSLSLVLACASQISFAVWTFHLHDLQKNEVIARYFSNLKTLVFYPKDFRYNFTNVKRLNIADFNKSVNGRKGDIEAMCEFLWNKECKIKYIIVQCSLNYSDGDFGCFDDVKIFKGNPELCIDDESKIAYFLAKKIGLKNF